MTALEPGTTLIEASAGTGKTFRIAHLFLRLVAEEGIGVDRIVVVTFTHAATAELRERIRHRLRDALQGLDARAAGQPWTGDDVLRAWVGGIRDPDPIRARLHRALVEFDAALISTIHGFCQRMLARNAFESGAAFGAELIGDVRRLVDEVVTDFWTNTVYDCDPALLPAFREGGIRRDTLADLAHKASNPDLPVVPPRVAAPPPDVEPWRRALLALRSAWNKAQIEGLLLDTRVMVQRKSKNNPVSYPPGATRKAIRAIDEAVWRWPAPTSPPPDELHVVTTEQVAAGTQAGRVPPSHPAFAAMDAYLVEHERLRPALVAFVQSLKHDLVATVRAELPRRARARNLRTFDDLLRMLRDALADATRGPALAAAIRSDFDVALIDEFQDTDPVQWAIFREVFEDRLCLIGDPKQAIYSFRGADIYTYRRAVKTRDHLLSLDRNHRSDGRLVQALNHLYGRARLPFGAADPAYVQVSAAHPPSRLPGDDRPPLELRFLPRTGQARINRGILVGGWLDDTLPHIVADDIAAELHRQTRIPGEDGAPRAIRPTDCAVLVRSNAQAEAMQRALRERGIPSVRKADDPVLRTAEAEHLATVLAAVNDPGDAVALRRALITPLFGRTADDLVAMEADDVAWRVLGERFRSWNALWTDHGFMAMFQALIDSEGLDAALLRRVGGVRILSNLNHLAELLHHAAIRLRLGPAGLLTWLRDGGPDADEEDAALRLESDADAVRVVTIHSAKGLEYPLVWCPSLLRGGFLTARDTEHLVFHDPDADDRATLDIGSPEHPAHVACKEQEQLEEDLRLVYVALTRARHRVVVYWGAAAYTSALGFLLHQDDADPTDQLIDKVLGRLRWADDDRLRTDLERLAQHPDIQLSTVDWSLASPAPDWDVGAGAAALSTRPITRRTAPDRGWRRSSFSALTRGVDPFDPQPGVDHDDDSEPAPPGDEDMVPLAELFGGVRTGNCLHAILEHLDFQADASAIVAERLAAHGFGPEWNEPVVRALAGVVRTPLSEGGFALADIAADRRLNELEFTFPVCGGFEPSGDRVRTEQLAAAFEHPDAPAGYAERLRRLAFVPLHGFLVGSIDLVFEREGRWYLADHKSNKLGRTWADYAPDALDHKMHVANYLLQAHLYVLALHRFLRSRLSDYDYDTHFGGVFYLFLRGMDPAHGPGAGVWAHRPTRAFVEHLDRTFGGGR